MEITNVVLEREDEKWLEKVPISPYPINRSRFSAMKGNSLLVKEEGQKYFLAFIRENLQTQGTKKKRRKKA